MMNRRVFFKFFHQFFIVLFITLLLFNCKKDPTSSDLSDDTYTLEETKTLGSGGGTIEINDFILSVPSGAFDSDYQIDVYASSVDDPFRENGISRSIKLSGLPREFSKPLRIGLQYQGKLSEESYLGIGNFYYDPVEVDSSIVYGLESASDSSGYLVGYLQNETISSSKILSPISVYRKFDEFDAFVNAITGYKTQKTTNFTIRIPITLISYTDRLGTLLEDTRTSLINLGFNLSEIPKNVVVEIIKSDDDEPNPIVVIGSNEINISREYVSSGQFSGIKLHFGHKLFFHIIKKYYNNYLNIGDLSHIWFHAAVSSWAQKLFTDDPNYQHPYGFAQNNLAPFNGMRAGAKTRDPGGDYKQMAREAINHGVGMSVMIEYLMEKDKLEHGLPNIYKGIKKGFEPTTVLLDSVNALVADWWPDFFKYYISSELYNILSSEFTDYGSLTDNWDINTDTDIYKKYSASYPDLSAKRYMVDLNHSTIDASANLIFDVSGEVTSDGIAVLVFVVDNNFNLKHLKTAQGPNSAVVPNLKEYYDKGEKQFLAVVVNSTHDYNYTGDQDIELTIRVSSQQTPAFNNCEIRLRATGHYSRTTGDDYDGYFVEEDILVTGSFSDKSFTGTAITHSSNLTITENITAELNSTQDTIISFTGSRDFLWSDGSIRKYEISGNGLPILVGSDANYSVFQIWGAESCDHIISLSHFQQAPTVGTQWILNDYQCDSGSNINVIFSTD